MIILRKCITCKVEKEATREFFYRDKNRALGLQYRCISCDKKRRDNRIYSERKANMTKEQWERKSSNAKRYAKTEKGKSIQKINSYLKYDKKRGYECDLTQDFITDILKNKKCYYCGYPPTGVDRIDNSIGHLMSNCIPCCRECNVARSNFFSVAETLLIGDVIRKIKDKRLDPPHIQIKQ